MNRGESFGRKIKAYFGNILLVYIGSISLLNNSPNYLDYLSVGMTFLSTSSAFPAPSSTQCPGLSTCMSNANSIGFPLRSSNNFCCSIFQILTIARITHALIRITHEFLTTLTA